MAKKKGEKTIIFEISPDGSITADADCFVKDTCLKELEALLNQVQSEPLVIERKDESEARLQKKTKTEISTQQKQTLRRKS